MYAIVEVGGRQWRVEPGMKLDVHRLSGAVGAEHTVERVLLAHDGQHVQIGRPYLPGASVVCEVLSHPLGPKAISYHFRRRENWRKTVGHRQPLTQLLVREIRLTGAPATEQPAAAEAPKVVRRKPAAAAAGRPKRPTAKKTS